MTYRSRLALLLTTVFALTACDSTSTGAQEIEDTDHSGPAMNFHRISPNLATGGHFTGDGISALKSQGVSLVVDLRDEPPNDLKQRLGAVGIEYINVPVLWSSPQAEDFAEFARHMSENEGEHIFVQCQANYRASAMTYAYRVAKDGVLETEARKDLEAVWTPEGTWEAYIDEILKSSNITAAPQ